jgi:hypothetical protein
LPAICRAAVAKSGTRVYLINLTHRSCCRFPADRGMRARHKPRSYRDRINLKVLLLLLILLLDINGPNAAKLDLGAGQAQTTRSGSSGKDAARAPSGHGCPFGAGPRSVVGVRVPDEVGPNQELGTFGYFWCLFKSDPPEGRKGESALPEKMDLPTIPMPQVCR